MAIQRNSFIFLIWLAYLFSTWASAQSSYSPKIDSLRRLQQDSAAVNYALQNAYYIYSENLDRADSIFTYIIATAQRKQWLQSQAFGHLYLGVTHYLGGAYKQANEQYYHALSLFDSLANDSGRGRTYNELAVFYHKTGDSQKAFNALDSAYHFCRKANDTQGIGTALEHRASFLFRQQKYSEARPYIDKVLAIRQKQQDTVGLSYVYLNLAEYYTATGAYEKALDKVKHSTRLRKAIGDTQGVIVNLVITGEILMSQKNYKLAIKYFRKGIKRARKIGFMDLERYANTMLEQCYLALKDYKKAYAHARESGRVKDSLFNLEKARAISELETQYQTERKEQKIALQKATLTEQEAVIERNTVFMIALTLIVILLILIYFLARYRFRKKRELMQREQQLQLQKTQIAAALSTQEEERKRVARDLHDGFGQLIAALRMHLDAADAHLQDATPQTLKQAENVLEQMHQEIRSAAFNLMPQVLIDGGLLPALKELAQRLNKAGKVKVSVAAFALENRLSETREVALYRIVQEWLTNVVKHAKAHSIQVQLVQHEEELNIIIEDDGMGFDPTILKRGKGNGWRNIQLRLQMINADGEVDSRPDMAGTTFVIHCPLQKQRAAKTNFESVTTRS